MSVCYITVADTRKSEINQLSKNKVLNQLTKIWAEESINHRINIKNFLFFIITVKLKSKKK